MMLFALFFFAAVYAPVEFGDTCKCYWFNYFFGKIRLGTTGSCVYPHVRHCMYNPATNDCECQNRYIIETDPPAEVDASTGAATRRNGVIIQGNVYNPGPVLGGVPTVQEQAEPEFSNLFEVPTVCSRRRRRDSDNGEARRLSDEFRSEASVNKVLRCVGGYVPTYLAGVQCNAKRIHIADYAIRPPKVHPDKMVNLDLYLNGLIAEKTPQKPEVCRLSTDCQVLERYETICRALDHGQCLKHDVCYWGEYAEGKEWIN